MFYCEQCRLKYAWPGSLGISRGKCECCGQVANCHDRPSGSLPPVPRINLLAATADTNVDATNTQGDKHG